MPFVRARFLGTPRFETRDGKVLPAPGPKAMAIIAYLASQQDGSATRAELAVWLWSEKHSASARHALRQCLFRLRERLGFLAPVLQADRETLQLNLDMLEIDIRHLEFPSAIGFDPYSVGALYRGQFCAGLDIGEEPVERWLRQRRDEIDRLAARSLEKSVEHMAAKGESDAAIQAAHKRVGIDPYDEAAQAALIATCMRFGRYGEAHAAHEACTAELERELGLAPGPAVRAALAVRPLEVPVAATTSPPRTLRARQQSGFGSPRMALTRAATRNSGPIAALVLLALFAVNGDVPEREATPPAAMQLWVSSDDAYSMPQTKIAYQDRGTGSDENPISDVPASEAVRRALRGEARYALYYPTGC